jgi:hypothetical protein
MIHRKALMLSIGVTTFLVVLVGGVYAAYARAGEEQPVEMTVEEMLEDPEVQAVLREREAAYQQMIDEANQRLEAQAAEQEQVQEQEQAEPETEEYPISVGLAVALGQDALDGGTLIRNVELVSVNGRAAYELIFDRGEVYIDAISGAILYNSSASEQMASRSGSDHDDDDDHEEHEEHEDHDDD